MPRFGRIVNINKPLAACNGTSTARDKMRSRADLNGDNLRIYRVYLRISDYCRVTVRVRVRVRVMVRVRVRNIVRVSIRIIALGLWLLIVVYKLLEK